MSAMPASSPQKAPPMPARVMPEAVVTKVRMAGRRAFVVGERGAERAGKARQQREAGDGLDQNRRRGGDEGGGERREERQREIGDAGRERGDPAPLRIGMGLGAGGERGGDRREVDGEAAEWRDQGAQQAGDGEGEARRPRRSHWRASRRGR